MQGSPSQVNGVGLRTLSRRRSWVRIPPPAPQSDSIALVLPVVLKLKSGGAIKDSVIKLNYIFTISNEMVSKVIFHLSKEKKQLIFDELSKRLDGLKA